MRRLFVCGATFILLAGCIAPNDSTNDELTSIAAAASDSSRAYLRDLAVEADEIARRIDAGELQNNAAVFEAFRSSSQKSRESFNRTLGQSLDQLAPPSAQPQSAMWRDLAAGFRAAAR